MEHGGVTESAGRSSLCICFISTGWRCSLYVFWNTVYDFYILCHFIAQYLSFLIVLFFSNKSHTSWQKSAAGLWGWDIDRLVISNSVWGWGYLQVIKVTSPVQGCQVWTEPSSTANMFLIQNVETDGHGSPPHESLMSSSLFHSLVSYYIFTAWK